MFEKHLYNKKFFNFVQELITYCCVDKVEPGVLIVENSNLTEKDKALFNLLTDCIEKLIFKVLIKASDNESI